MFKSFNLIVFLLISTFIFSQDFNQVVKYKGIELNLPQTWNYQLQETSENLVYQISCWEKGYPNSFVIQLIEDELDIEYYIESIKASQKEQLIYKNTDFEKNSIGNFKNVETLFSSYSGDFHDIKFYGKIIAFSHNGRTIFIIYQGDEDFNRKTADKMLSSTKVDFLDQNILTINTRKWSLYEIGDIAFLGIPPTLELRNQNSFNTLLKKIVNDYYSMHKKVEMKNSNFIFQPKGMDSLDKNAFSLYSRILISYVKGKDGDFLKWNEKFEPTSSEYTELNEYSKKEVNKLFNNTENKLINWYPLEFGEVNGYCFIKRSYIRQMGNNPEVIVKEYQFYNYNEIITITFSYRLIEKDIWENDFNKVLTTFSFKNKIH